jgi:hypothetical protein
MKTLKFVMALLLTVSFVQANAAQEQEKPAADHKEIFELLTRLKLDPVKKTPTLDEVKASFKKQREGEELPEYYVRGYEKFLLLENFINSAFAMEDETKPKLPNPRILGHLNPDGPYCGPEITKWCDSLQSEDAFYCLYEHRTVIQMTESGKTCLSNIQISVPETDRGVAQALGSVSQIR